MRAKQAVHATAIAIEGCAIVIRGPSGSGKSALAAALIATSRPQRRVELVGDDRVILSRTEGALTTHPHPRIAGFIERRGFGIVAMPYLACAPTAGVVELGVATAPPAELQNLPTLCLFGVSTTDQRRALVDEWYDDLVAVAAYRSQVDQK